MTIRNKRLAIAGVAVAIGIGLAYAGVPVSTLLLIGAVLGMIFMHAGGHGGCGGGSHSREGHRHSGDTAQQADRYDGTTAR